jgi:cyclophilin family peptidyl-prolyl cis-trans isomerase
MFTTKEQTMATGVAGGRRVRPLGLFAAGLVILTLAGCNRQSQDTQVDFKPDTGTKPKTDGQPQPAKVALDPRMHKPLKEATLSEPPEGQNLPEKTKAGLSVGKLFLDVQKEWDDIHFATDTGKKLLYSAKISTELGDVPLHLFPEAAPNHVRSFVALAKVKYYDGLAFDYVLKGVKDEKNPTPVDLLVGGDPKGTFEMGYGSIGYWLKPEKNDLKHEPGTVGAFHEQAADTAACKFYITLDKAPALDSPDALWTIFGRVTPEGLAVARKIAARPGTAADPGRPQQPVVIRTVTIEVQEGGPVEPPGEKK